MKRIHLLRAAAVILFVLGIALAGGSWIASAEGTIPPGTGLPIYTVNAYDIETATDASDYIEANIGNWYGHHAVYSPCGWFELLGHGDYYVSLSDAPSCGTNLILMCLGSDGSLTAQTVTQSSVTPDGHTLSARIEQDGHCGIFNIQSVPQGAEQGYINPSVISS